MENEIKDLPRIEKALGIFAALVLMLFLQEPYYFARGIEINDTTLLIGSLLAYGFVWHSNHVMEKILSGSPKKFIGWIGAYWGLISWLTLIPVMDGRFYHAFIDGHALAFGFLMAYTIPGLFVGPILFLDGLRSKLSKMEEQNSGDSEVKTDE